MTIHYIENGNVIDIRTNMSVAPTPRDIVEINGYLYKVKAVIWHLEIDRWIEVFLK